MNSSDPSTVAPAMKIVSKNDLIFSLKEQKGNRLRTKELAGEGGY